MTTSARTPPFLWVLLTALLAGAVGSQVVLDARPAPSLAEPSVTWVRSPEIMRRLALGFDDLLADIYWIRAVQVLRRYEVVDGGERRNTSSCTHCST